MIKNQDNLNFSDILQTSEGDRVIVLEDNNSNRIVKVLLDDEDLNLKNFDENEGFFMNLDNFIKYNSFYKIGNKFNFEGSKNLNYEKSRGFNQTGETT